MNSMTNITSIRVKNLHIDASSDIDNPSVKDFPSINKAKAHSRELGGASRVRTAKSMKDARELMRVKKETSNG